MLLFNICNLIVFVISYFLRGVNVALFWRLVVFVIHSTEYILYLTTIYYMIRGIVAELDGQQLGCLVNIELFYL